MKGISKKQAGVIYAAIKRGNLTDETKAASAMYNCYVGTIEVWNTNQAHGVEEAIAALRNCINFIFEGNYKLAQKAFDDFAEVA